MTLYYFVDMYVLATENYMTIMITTISPGVWGIICILLKVPF